MGQGDGVAAIQHDGAAMHTGYRLLRTKYLSTNRFRWTARSSPCRCGGGPAGTADPAAHQPPGHTGTG
ncbi:hypothetical protein BZL30_9410 [Mycobacterium kansasii]|uniref:Uncharacterized protein n=1 Tax=Mycobacterium kansasii TaxID=1768 RepID=A0A1V3W9R0_MYCKA|nr:hypothetical protein BZL30_9410 [Mycobacterium kansasii]